MRVKFINFVRSMTTPSQRRKGHVSLLLCNTIWGAAVPVSKFILAGGIISSKVLADIRILSGTILFWLASSVLKSEREERVEKGDYFKLFQAAFFSTALVQLFYMKGISLSSPAEAAICMATLPIWTVIMSALHLRERVDARKVGGIIIGMSGTLLLALYGRTFTSGGSLSGIACCLLSQISYGIYLVFFQDIIKKYSPITLMKWKYLFGLVMLLPFSIREVLLTQWALLSPRVWLAIGFVIIFSTFISYFLVPFGQKYLQPTTVAMYNNLQPVAASLIALAASQESPSLVKAAAMLLVFLGVFLVSRRGGNQGRNLFSSKNA